MAAGRTVARIRLTVVPALCLCLVAGWPSGRGRTSPAVVAGSARVVLDFDVDWRFAAGDFASAAMPAFDDSGWRRLDVPHDWSAAGPFTAAYGSGNGYAPGGVGWYRKHFVLAPEHDGRQALVEFDGVYDHAEVWVNGHFVCQRPYGYASFACPLTPHVRFGGDPNVIAVRVDHSRIADSRWYTGSGIYRHVRLCLRAPLHIARWGTFVTTPDVDEASAAVRIDTTVENESGARRTVVIESEIARQQVVVARVVARGDVGAGGTITMPQSVAIPRPARWSPDAPALYVLRQRLRTETAEGEVVDDAETSFGVRTFRFDPDRGFVLNGVPTTLEGVCVHHDAGSLGAAVPAEVWERRLTTLKSIGVNAVRTSHNPPAPEFLDLCDRLGLLVMDEAFDEFTPPKNKWVTGWNDGVPSRFGYGEEFARWAVTDIEDMVRRDRNHPSIVLWSIGNEVDYPNDPFTHPVLEKGHRPLNPRAENLVSLARPLVAAVRRLDPSRPITAALASVKMSEAVGFVDLLDVVGYNYQESRYAEDRREHPRRVILGSENNHQHANWVVVRDHAHVAGQFLWTGIDYLGEARRFPNRANGAGLLDLTGHRKPSAYFRQSLWSRAPVVRIGASPAGTAGSRRGEIVEHWNWPSGSTIRVRVSSNCPETQVRLNGRLIGSRRLAEAVDGALVWDVPFAPGEIEAIGLVDGRPVANHVLKTAGPPARVELQVLSALGRVREIEFRIVDAAGVLVADSAAVVTLGLDGPARLLGLGNGHLDDVDDCQDLSHRAYLGRGLAILRLLGGQDSVTVRASAPGLEAAVLAVPAAGASERRVPSW